MNDRRLPGDPVPETTTFDLSELFPNAKKRLPDGRTVQELWYEQDAQEAQERRRLLQIVQEGEERRQIEARWGLNGSWLKGTK